MQLVEDHTESIAINLAREYVYRFLATVLTDPHQVDPAAVSDAPSRRLVAAAADLLRADAERQDGAPGFGELPASLLALEPVLEELNESFSKRSAQFDGIFGLLTCRECPPYETEYHPSQETFYRAQQLADIAGFYQAFGLRPASARPERPDHIVLELEFMAFLLLKRRRAREAATETQRKEWETICDEAQRDFVRDHLAWWVPAFAAGLRRKAGTGFYAAVGQVLAAWMPLERRRFNLPAPRLPLQPALIEKPEEQDGCLTCQTI